SEPEIILSKFLSACTVAAFVLVLTATYPLTLAYLAHVDSGALIGAYAGLFLTAMLLLSAGLFASTLPKNQVVSFILAFFIGYFFLALGQIGSFIPIRIASVTDFVGLASHIDTLSRGVFDSRDLAYYASWIIVFACLSVAQLQSLRANTKSILCLPRGNA